MVLTRSDKTPVETEEGFWKVIGCSARKAVVIHLGHGDKQDQREPKLAYPSNMLFSYCNRRGNN